MGTSGGLTMRRPRGSMGWIKLAMLGVVLSVFLFQGVACETEPTESQCRPYIEKALKEQHVEEDAAVALESSKEESESPTDELLKDPGDVTEGTDEEPGDSEEGDVTDDGDNQSLENEGEKTEEQDAETEEEEDQTGKSEEVEDGNDEEDGSSAEKGAMEVESVENVDEKVEDANDENVKESEEEGEVESQDQKSAEGEDGDDSLEKPIDIEVQEIQVDDDDDVSDGAGEDEQDDAHSREERAAEVETETKEEEDGETEEVKDDKESEEKEDSDKTESEDKMTEEEEKDDAGAADEEAKDEDAEKDVSATEESQEDGKEETVADEKTEPETTSEMPEPAQVDKVEVKEVESQASAESGEAEEAEQAETSQEEPGKEPEEEELIQEFEIPDNLRSREHINEVLKLDEDSGLEKFLGKTIDSTLKSLKGLYDTAIKPLEMLYKYRDLSNRHYGDPEIFSKPLVLFMGPWSGGKSSTINYLLNNEFSRSSLRTGAEPSPAYFNILMHGEEEEVLDGTQLAADWTFSGLQKFGQGLLDRLKGTKLPNKLLEKVNIVEIPGILEIRKQVQRLFPFNDACQWFIDRADIIFLVYDPSKLDVGPETEAILDQLKGREYQTRIILNKADQVKPEELMRVQGTLIWNISPLMSSTEPPVMYSTSLWSMPYESGAPTRLLLAQERAFLRDLREAIDKRVENKISSARRFAVRVRNHAKMVDCYLTTYYNHKSFFGNRKKISDDIIENPQKYHIYEGLSTLTNISRYDLPDPDVYRDFFKINPLYDFQKLSETCTYFRGCPINKLDVAIAYDLPELVGKYRKAVDAAKEQLQKEKS